MPGSSLQEPARPGASLPSLGMLEVSSIARGVVVADAAVKQAEVVLLQSRPVSPGKHIVVLAGEVAEVEEAMKAGAAAAGSTLLDRLYLPLAHQQLAPLLADATSGTGARSGLAPLDSVAIFETLSLCATVLAADAAAKAADVCLLELRLGAGLGGKGYFTLGGSLDSVEAAVAAGRAAIEPALLVATEIIPAPHADLLPRLIF